jgi:nuclear transcription factor Y, gamma
MQQGQGQGGQGGPPGGHVQAPAGMSMIYGQPYGQQFSQAAPHPGDPNAQQQWQQQARAAQLQQAQIQAYHMQSHHVNQQHQQQLRMFWQQQMQEIESGGDFKNHQLPLARIKKIMKSDEDVRMISSEAPVLFAKACEMFILELTLRSWIHSEENKRRTLQRNDIAAAITKTDIFDFLVDIVPRDDFKEDGMNVPRAPPAAVALGAPGGGDGQGGAGQAGAVPAVPYNPGMYYMQPPPGTMVGGQWPPQMSQDPYQNQMPPKQ